MNAFYSTFINRLYDQCDYLEKILKRDLKKEDLGLILNGKPGWSCKYRPLLGCATPQGIGKAWATVGAAVAEVAGYDSADPDTRQRVRRGGVTRQSLNDARLRLPPGKRPSDIERPASVNARADNVAKVQKTFEYALLDLEREGFSKSDLGSLAVAPKPKVSRLDDFNPNIVSALTDVQKLEEIAQLSKLSSGNVFIKIGPEPWNSTVMLLGFVERALVKARAEQDKLAAKHSARLEVKKSALAILAKSAAAGAKEPTSDEYMTLCRFRKVLNPSTLTTKAARKAAYEAAVRSCPDLPEEEPEQRDVHVLAGFSLSNVDELIQRIKACDIKNCFRLPQTALGRASVQPDYFVERSPPAPPAPSPPAALPSARATNEMAQSVFDSVMELQGEEIYS